MDTLKSIMEARGIPQRALAEQLKVSEPTVSRWARRGADVPTRYIEPIARILGVSVDVVLAVAVTQPVEAPPTSEAAA
jgi:transcriptional regulator with XRE-family HTH domain